MAMNQKSAVKALERVRALSAEIEEIMRENGIAEKQAELSELKSKVTEWAATEGVKHIDLDGAHATLVEPAHNARFIGTKDDLPEASPAGRKIVPLKSIIYKKFPKGEAKEIWNRVTKRIVVKEAVEEVVSEGLLSVKEIAPSFIEDAKKPYLRIYEDK